MNNSGQGCALCVSWLPSLRAKGRVTGCNCFLHGVPFLTLRRPSNQAETGGDCGRIGGEKEGGRATSALRCGTFAVRKCHTLRANVLQSPPKSATLGGQKWLSRSEAAMFSCTKRGRKQSFLPCVECNVLVCRRLRKRIFYPTPECRRSARVQVLSVAGAFWMGEKP